MTTKVALVELTVFPRVVPLASGYMEATCRKDPELANDCRFDKISFPVKTSYEEILAALERSDADVYGFSCYVWNSRMVRRLRKALHAAKPRADIILGGPQVMHQAVQYVLPEEERVFVCNGEGERTFANFLRAVRSPDRNFSAVKGLSFFSNGTLVTTEAEPRIANLSEVPSPFLQGLYGKDDYTWVLIETNRGCPFKCNYCFWGAATGARVYRYEDERLEQELTWIAQSSCLYLFIADANFGMLKRDVDISRFIVQAHQRYGAPLSVFFCASKNTPDRVEEISAIFHDAGLVSCQAVALQTLNPETLVRVNRENIKSSAYLQLQQSLNRHGVSSYVEMIWPLPGETLATFRAGLSHLCEMGADSFIVYPLMLINNVELMTKREEYGLVSIPDPDPNSEAEIVVETAEVDRTAYEEGVRYAYAVISLYAVRGLRSLARYLSTTGLMSYDDFFGAFVGFARARPDHPWTEFCEKSIRSFEHVAFANAGELVYLMLHAQREAFDTLLEQFVASQPFACDPTAQFLLEVDLINRPYVYLNTPIVPKKRQFAQMRRVETGRDGYIVHVPEACLPILREHVAVDGSDPSSTVMSVVHRRRCQMPVMARKSLHENFMYCQDMRDHMRDLLPVWQSLPEAMHAA